jgi:hypothetical protein
MYIGRLGTNSFFQNITAAQRRSVLPQTFSSVQSQSPQRDRVEIGNSTQRNNDAGIYRPSQMQTLNVPHAEWVSADADLSQELLPPSERGEYTEKDALLNQYSKQYRLENGGGKLMGNVSDEQLEQFRNELVANGLGDDIDWKGVEMDFVQIGVNFDNASRFEQKADYIASRYAILKDRIQTQYTGDKQASEMQKLEQIYSAAKEEMANAYADSIGNFYEDLGQNGAAKDMRESVLAAVDGKAEEYSAYLAQNDIYGAITDPEKQWLKQDDAYMAAQLRNSVLATQTETRTQQTDAQAAYSANDLQFAGVFAGELSHKLKDTEEYGRRIVGDWNVSDINGNDAELGKEFAELILSAGQKADNSGVSDKTLDMVKNSLMPFLEKFMDALDKEIDQNAGRLLFRTHHIDRNEVYSAFQAALGEQF